MKIYELESKPSGGRWIGYGYNSPRKVSIHRHFDNLWDNDVQNGYLNCVKFNYIREGKQGERRDYPAWDQPIPIYSAKVVDAIGKEIQRHGRLFQIDVEGDKYYVQNLCERLYAYDYDESEIEYYPSGSPRKVLKYAMRAKAIGDRSIFRMTMHPSQVFATDTFREMVESHDFTGFQFKEINMKWID